MKTEHGSHQVHVFVCTNRKDGNRACCAQKNAEELRNNLKSWVKSRPEWKGRVRINASGCLDRCSEGIAVAVYPQNEWWLNVESTDEEALKKKIETLAAEPE